MRAYKILMVLGCVASVSAVSPVSAHAYENSVADAGVVTLLATFFPTWTVICAGHHNNGDSLCPSGANIQAAANDAAAMLAGEQPTALLLETFAGMRLHLKNQGVTLEPTDAELASALVLAANGLSPQ